MNILDQDTDVQLLADTMLAPLLCLFNQEVLTNVFRVSQDQEHNSLIQDLSQNSYSIMAISTDCRATRTHLRLLKTKRFEKILLRFSDDPRSHGLSLLILKKIKMKWMQPENLLSLNSFRPQCSI